MTNDHASGGSAVPAQPLVLVVGECLVDLAPTNVPASGADMAPATMPAAGGAELSPAPSGPRPPPVSSARHFIALPGGGPANAAVGLARLGVTTAFAGRFSRAGFGPWLRQHLTTNGVDLALSIDAPQAATLAVVTLDRRGQASYTFYGPETADWQWAEDELPAAEGPGAPGSMGIAAVHTGSLAAVFEPGASVLARWLAGLHDAAGVLISFDPNVRPGLVDDLGPYRRRVEGMVASAHIVKASIDDIEALYPGASPLDVAQQWLSAGATLVLVTEGELGASAAHRNGLRARSVPPRVKVADTIGAGDAFTSGLLAYLAEAGLLTPAGTAGMTEVQLQAALAQAVTVSALTCTRPGADPPNRQELAAFIRGRAGAVNTATL